MVKQLLKGNEAFAEAAIRAGVEGFFGYPITPSTEFLEYMSKRMPELGRAFVQARKRNRCYQHGLRRSLYREKNHDRLL